MTDKRLKILHVVPDLRPGGAPLGVCELVAELAGNRKYSVHLCILGHASAGRAPASCQAVTYLGLSSPIAGSAELGRGVGLLKALIQQEAIDIVHSHLLPADLVSAMAVAAAGKAIHVAHIRDTRTWLRSSRPRDVTKKLLFRMAYSLAKTQFIAVSHDAAAFAAHQFDIPAARMSVVLNGIAIAPFAGSGAGSREPRHGSAVIGAAGRLVAEKGHATLIEATARVLRAGHDVRLEIAGTGSRHADLVAAADAVGVRDRLVLRGQVADMAKFYRDLDIFVLPSIESEGLPRVLLEAMASGIPVVATQCEGVGDVLTDGEQGLTVGKQNPEAMAAAIIRLLEDRALATRLAATGRSLVLQRFTVERVASEVVEHYARLIGQNRKAIAA